MGLLHQRFRGRAVEAGHVDGELTWPVRPPVDVAWVV
jgi:hypothetical protein